jgi:hypothetical protein
MSHVFDLRPLGQKNRLDFKKLDYSTFDFSTLDFLKIGFRKLIFFQKTFRGQSPVLQFFRGRIARCSRPLQQLNKRAKKAT